MRKRYLLLKRRSEQEMKLKMQSTYKESEKKIESENLRANRNVKKFNLS